MNLDSLLPNLGEWLRGTGPESDVVVSTRIRLARNLAQFPFAGRATVTQKGEIEARAKEAFAKTALNMPATTRTGLMAFGAQRAKDCTDIGLVSPIGSQTPAELVPTILQIEAKGETPIAEAVRQGAEVLRQYPDASNSMTSHSRGESFSVSRAGFSGP